MAILPSKEPLLTHQLTSQEQKWKSVERIMYLQRDKVPANPEFYIPQKSLSMKNAICFLVFCLGERCFHPNKRSLVIKAKKLYFTSN